MREGAGGGQGADRGRDKGRRRRPRRLASLVGTVAVSVLLLGLLGFGYGAIPALGPVLDPGRGAWTSASGGQPVSSQRLRVPGLDGPVTISFSAQGLASVSAGNTHDLFLAEGYLQARFRLTELDAERRLGEGRLAQLAGPADVASDEFELRLGLLRTAQNEWARTAGPARAALLAYVAGVNDDIAQVRVSGDWPALFALGTVRTADWFPLLAQNAQTPYDPGPYVKAPLTPVAADLASSVPDSGSGRVFPAGGSSGGGSTGTARSADSSAAAVAASVLSQLSQLLPDETHQYPDSNAWAANGPAVSGGGALLGGDPHLEQTLPSIWYEVALSAPGYQVAGVSVVGLPAVLLGTTRTSPGR
jgi:penicillin G amidase